MKRSIDSYITTKDEMTSPNEPSIRRHHSRFPKIVHTMITEADDSVISWVEDGDAFVFKIRKKIGDVLQTYFQHKKYSSFQRQLNMYGWKKYNHGKFKGAFHHPHFHRDKGSTDDLVQIRRKGPPSETRKKQKLMEMHGGAIVAPCDVLSEETSLCVDSNLYTSDTDGDDDKKVFAKDDCQTRPSSMRKYIISSPTRPPPAIALRRHSSTRHVMRYGGGVKLPPSPIETKSHYEQRGQKKKQLHRAFTHKKYSVRHKEKRLLVQNSTCVAVKPTLPLSSSSLPSVCSATESMRPTTIPRKNSKLSGIKILVTAAAIFREIEIRTGRYMP